MPRFWNIKSAVRNWNKFFHHSKWQVVSTDATGDSLPEQNTGATSPTKPIETASPSKKQKRSSRSRKKSRQSTASPSTMSPGLCESDTRHSIDLSLDKINTEACRSLWASVLIQAVLDLNRHSYRASAHKWIWSESTEPHSLRWICDTLDIDADRVQLLCLTREGRKRIIHGGEIASRSATRSKR